MVNYFLLDKFTDTHISSFSRITYMEKLCQEELRLQQLLNEPVAISVQKDLVLGRVINKTATLSERLQVDNWDDEEFFFRLGNILNRSL